MNVNHNNRKINDTFFINLNILTTCLFAGVNLFLTNLTLSLLFFCTVCNTSLLLYSLVWVFWKFKLKLWATVHNLLKGIRFNFFHTPIVTFHPASPWIIVRNLHVSKLGGIPLSCLTVLEITFKLWAMVHTCSRVKAGCHCDMLGICVSFSLTMCLVCCRVSGVIAAQMP